MLTGHVTTMCLSDRLVALKQQLSVGRTPQDIKHTLNSNVLLFVWWGSVKAPFLC